MIRLNSLRSVTSIAALAASLILAGCKSQAPAAPTDDASLSSALQSRIAGDSAIKNEPIQTSVQNGVATLSGTVSSEAARSLAANDAAQVAGIRTVINNLSVQQAPPPSAAPATAVVTPPPVPEKTIPKKPSAAVIQPKRATRDSAPIERSLPPERETHPLEAHNDTPPPPAPTPVPAPPPPPAFREVTIASGSTLPVRITQTLDSSTTQQGESFTGTVATDVIVDGLVAIPQGTPVTGRVDAVQEAAHFKGASLLTIELTNLNRRGERIPITTEPFTKEGTGRGKNTAEKVGGGAAVGAILGGILGGGKGAAVGAAAGGGLGAGAQAVTKGQQVQIPSETLIRFRLTNAISVRASTSGANHESSDPSLQRHPLQ